VAEAGRRRVVEAGRRVAWSRRVVWSRRAPG